MDLKEKMSDDKRKNYHLIIPVWIVDQDGYSARTKDNMGLFGPEKCSITVVAETPEQALNLFHEKLQNLFIS